MIKLIQCVHRKPEISLQEFRRRWEDYGQVIMKATAEVHAVRCTLSTTLVIKENLQIVLNRGTAQPFDGVAEIWFEDAPRVVDLIQQPEFQAQIRAFQSFQESFIDLESSAFFLAAEDAVFERS